MMRALLLIICISLTSPPAAGRANAGQNKDAKVREELRQLWQDYIEAASKRDRQALERMFAEGYVWVRFNGSIADRARHIDDILSETRPSAAVPPFDQLFASGDTAVLRLVGADPDGATAFTTIVLAKSGGRWQFVHRQGTRLPPERKPIQLDPEALNALVGRYEFEPGRVTTVAREGDALTWRPPGKPKYRLLPLSETRFYAEGTDAEMIFRRGDRGQVTGVTLRLGAVQESEAKRVE